MYFARSMSLKISNETRDIGRFHNKMNVIQRKNKTVDFKIFILLTITEGFENNVPAIMPIKKIVLFLNGKSKKIRRKIQIFGFFLIDIGSTISKFCDTYKRFGSGCNPKPAARNNASTQTKKTGL